MNNNKIDLSKARRIYLIDGDLFFELGFDGVYQVSSHDLTPSPTEKLDDYMEHPYLFTTFTEVSYSEASDIMNEWNDGKRDKEKEITERAKNSVSKIEVNRDNEYWCPVYEGMISDYDCEEISFGADRGYFVNDGLPFLMDIEKVTERRTLCLTCEKRK